MLSSVCDGSLKAFDFTVDHTESLQDAQLLEHNFEAGSPGNQHDLGSLVPQSQPRAASLPGAAAGSCCNGTAADQKAHSAVKHKQQVHPALGPTHASTLKTAMWSEVLTQASMHGAVQATVIAKKTDQTGPQLLCHSSGQCCFIDPQNGCAINSRSAGVMKPDRMRIKAQDAAPGETLTQYRIAFVEMGLGKPITVASRPDDLMALHWQVLEDSGVDTLQAVKKFVAAPPAPRN